MAEPLPNGLKMLNQRFLAEHCLHEDQVKEIYQEIIENNNNEQEEELPQSLKHAIIACNLQLQYIGLEIVAVCMNNKKDDNNDENENNNSNSTQNRNKVVRYYTMVNKFPDSITKTAYQHSIFHQQQKYVKAVLQKLVEDGGSTSRRDLINVKTIVDISVSTAEETLERLIQEKWIIDQTGKRRQSNNAQLSIGPRTYCELSYMLKDEFGMEQDDIPQQLYYK